MAGSLSNPAVKTIPRSGPWRSIVPWSLITAASLTAFGELPVNTPLAITSLSVEGTNLILRATIPPGMGRVMLETCPTLGGEWAEAGAFGTSVGENEIAFTIPKPAGPTEFFRLNATPLLAGPGMMSGELEYVTMSSLGSEPTEAGDAIFHFKGSIDGSDKIVITRDGALWEHVNWDWPQGAVAVNHTQWNPRQKNYLTTVGARKFLPEPFSLDSVDLEVIQGRDIVALERADQALIVYLDDTPGGADNYEFKIHFHPARPKPVHPGAPVAAHLKIAADIDGSDTLKITAGEATWEHKNWSPPANIRLNEIPWLLSQTNVLKNEGTNRFLPAGIDFSTAKIVSRAGRDLATMWAEPDALWVRFADNPNGSDHYELDISFGQ